MSLKRQHRAQSGFPMSSMTDVIFLLLIFFMVTSTFVFPSEMEINLPQSGQQAAIKPSTIIFIDKEMKMSVQENDSTGRGEERAIQPEQLEGFLTGLHESDPSQFVALHADQDVPYGKIVEVLDKGARSGVKVVLATRPADNHESTAEKVE